MTHIYKISSKIRCIWYFLSYPEGITVSPSRSIMRLIIITIKVYNGKVTTHQHHFFIVKINLKALSYSKIKNVNYLLRHILGKISEWMIFDAH